MKWKRDIMGTENMIKEGREEWEVLRPVSGIEEETDESEGLL